MRSPTAPDLWELAKENRKLGEGRNNWITLAAQPRCSATVLQLLFSLLMAGLVDACCVGSGSPGFREARGQVTRAE